MAHHGINALVVDIAFLDTQVKRVAVDGYAIGKCGYLAVNIQCAADGPKAFSIVKDLLDGLALHNLAVGILDVADSLGIIAPALQQLQALGEH